MDVDEKDSTEEPTNEATKARNVEDRPGDDDGEKIAKEDLENAIIKMSAKTVKQWRDYERSLERPTQDSATEDPLRRSMEDLKLRGKNSPGATTSSSLNASRTSRPNTKKKGKRPNTQRNDGRGTNNEMVAGRLVDPSGSVDHPHQNPERDRLDDDGGDKIAKEDLENAIIKMSAKTIKQWRDYEKSLERPSKDSATEDPLRRSRRA